jgi:hypothetical protein
MSDRPKCDIASPQDPCYSGSASIDDQVGTYNQSKQPHLGDINARVGQLPAAPDDRLTNVIGGLKD